MQISETKKWKNIAILMIKNKNKNEIIITPSSIKHNQNEYISDKK